MTALELVNNLRARGLEVLTDGHRIGIRPAGSLSAEEREAIRAHKAEVLAVLAADLAAPMLRRVEAFRRQLEEWKAAGRAVTEAQVGLSGPPHPCLPLFALPGVGAVAPGSCVSCAEPLGAGRKHRCQPCVDAVHEVIEGPAL